MTHSIFDTSPVSLVGEITTAAELDMLHGSTSLASKGDNLFDELRSLTEATVHIADFDHDGSTHEVHAWEELADGSLSKWSRGSGDSVSGARADMDADVIVLSVASGYSVPAQPAPAAGPPAPGTVQKKVRIKIRKQTGLPLP